MTGAWEQGEFCGVGGVGRRGEGEGWRDGKGGEETSFGGNVWCSSVCVGLSVSDSRSKSVYSLCRPRITGAISVGSVIIVLNSSYGGGDGERSDFCCDEGGLWSFCG